MNPIIIPKVPFYLSNGLIKEFKEDLEAKETHQNKMSVMLNEMLDLEDENQYHTMKKIADLIIEFNQLNAEIDNLEIFPDDEDDFEMDILCGYQGGIAYKLDLIIKEKGVDYFYRASLNEGATIYHMSYSSIINDMINIAHNDFYNNDLMELLINTLK